MVGKIEENVVITFSNYNANFSAASAACADVKAAADAYQASVAPAYHAISCTSDPVANGTIIYFNPFASWTITNLVDLDPSRYSNEIFLLQALLVVACVFIFVRGYDSGNKL